MEIERFEIEGLILLKPRVFSDERGYFLETFNLRSFLKSTGLDVDFVQDNESQSAKNVVRGLHFQLPPFDQGKLVRVVRGKVKDVAVDLRKNSPTYGRHQSVILSEKNKHQFYIPPGFAHGFSVLEDQTIFSYKCTGYYHQESEVVLQWNDKDLNIDWEVETPVLSKKDLEGNLTLKQFTPPELWTIPA